MFPQLSPEQIEIRDVVRKAAQAEIPAFQNEKFYGSLPRQLFSSLAQVGLAGIAVSEEYSGIAANPLTCALIMEELAAVDLGPAIFVSVHAMVCGLIERLGSAAQRSKYLARMAKGELLGAFALTEPSAGSDAAALKSQARADGENFILNGEKCYITSAGWADLYIVFARSGAARDEAQISAFIVEANSPGLTISPPEHKMGCELSPIASIKFEDVRLSKSQLLGELHRGYRAALSGLAGGRVSIAACAVGLMRSAIERASSHLKERKQFGKTLAEFQGLQFMLADMYQLYEAARLLTAQAALTLANNSSAEQIRLHTSSAKCFATDAAMKVTTDAAQLLGGAGYIRDYQVERLMREAKMLQIVEGTNQIQRGLIAREVLRGS